MSELMGSQDETPISSSAQPNASQDELTRLRRLLLGTEYDRALHAMTSRSDTERVAASLTEAIIQRHIRDRSVGEALGPIIDEALSHSIRTRPQRIIRAIYPIIGPAIRKSVTRALADMVLALNQILESSLSLRAWSWRFSAWRAGIPYGEYVLLKTLDFRVEQVLLIHRKTGILLHAEHAEGVQAEDPELVSSMLAAISDFVSDSFPGGATDSIENIRVGNFILEIETGPSAILVAAVRGTPSEDVGEALCLALERIHRVFGRDLTHFEGDRTPFATTADILQSCLLERRKYPGRGGVPWFAMVILLCLLVLGGILGYRKIQAETQYAKIKKQISQTSGYLLTGEHKRRGQADFEVLRSPTSIFPGQLIESLPKGRWQIQIRDHVAPLDLGSYLAPLLAETLDLGKNVHFSVEGEVLVVKGILTAGQLERLADSNLVKSAYQKIDTTGVTLPDGSFPDPLINRWHQLQAEIATTRFQFLPNTAELVPGMQQKIPQLLERLKEIEGLAKTIPVERWQLFIIGYADSTGTETANQLVSEERAQLIRKLLEANGIAPPTLLAWGTGHKSGNKLPDDQQRTVTLQLLHAPIQYGEKKGQ